MKRILSIVVAVALQGCATQSGYHDARSAASHGDYASAVATWTELAEQGHAEAQYQLATLYDQGEGADQDYLTAIKWYTLAAEQGHADAQNDLGVMYDDGHGVAPDYNQAIKWYSLASRQGDIVAQYNLGSIYRLEDAVQDNMRAYMWWSISARLGNILAVSQLEHIEEDMSSEQIRLARIMARKCLIKNYRGC